MSCAHSARSARTEACGVRWPLPRGLIRPDFLWGPHANWRSASPQAAKFCIRVGGGAMIPCPRPAYRFTKEQKRCGALKDGGVKLGADAHTRSAHLCDVETPQLQSEHISKEDDDGKEEGREEMRRPEQEGRRQQGEAS